MAELVKIEESVNDLNKRAQTLKRFTGPVSVGVPQAYCVVCV
jgi:hypothetical protein